MSDLWAAASAAIDAVFSDREPLIYTGAGLVAQPVSAIRSDGAAPPFPGPGATLRRITYEIDKAALPTPPSKKNTFVHRGTVWLVEEITSRDDIGKWELVVVDGGPAS